MARCAYCEQLILVGGTASGERRFCNARCESRFLALQQQPGFCAGCIASTLDESAGGTFVLNGFGTRMYGSAERCTQCASVRQTKFVTALFVPVFPLGSYRVKYIGPRRYLSRKER